MLLHAALAMSNIASNVLPPFRSLGVVVIPEKRFSGGDRHPVLGAFTNPSSSRSNSAIRVGSRQPEICFLGRRRAMFGCWGHRSFYVRRFAAPQEARNSREACSAPNLPKVQSDASSNRRCFAGCDFGNSADPCAQDGNTCVPGAEGYTCGNGNNNASGVLLVLAVSAWLFKLQCLPLTSLPSPRGCHWRQ